MTKTTPAEVLRQAREALIDLDGAFCADDYGTREGRDKGRKAVIAARATVKAIDALPSAPSGEPAATFSPVTVLPDGSAFATAAFPLPKDHWLTAPRGEWDSERDEYAECPAPILTHAHRDAVRAAVRYAVRGATMCGQDSDFDPDALVLNAIYALCGPFGGATTAPAPLPAEWRKAVQEAYGWLWHVNQEPMAPAPMWEPEKAAYQARKCLRDLLTSAERGEAINAIAAHIDKIAAGIGAAPLLSSGLTPSEAAGWVDANVSGNPSLMQAMRNHAAPQAATASVAGLADHAPAGPEAEAATDAALGMVLLPPIRVSANTYAALKRIAEARGMVLQAVVREALEPAETMGVAPQAAPVPAPSEPTDAQVAMLDPWMRPAAARELLRKVLASTAVAAPEPVAQVESTVSEALRNLADHAKFEAAMMGACDGSMSAQKAACLEWLACGAEYQHMLLGGPAVNTGRLLAAEQDLVKQIKFLIPHPAPAVAATVRGLTDAQFRAIYAEAHDLGPDPYVSQEDMAFGRGIEAAHGIATPAPKEQQP